MQNSFIYLCRGYNESVEREVFEFMDIASRMKILYNQAGNFHPQYEGFNFNGEFPKKVCLNALSPSQHYQPFSVTSERFLVFLG